MNTLSEILAFTDVTGTVGLHVGEPFRLAGLRAVGDLVPLLSDTGRTSMRAMILELENLPPIALEAKLIGNDSGEAPFQPRIQVNPSSGVILETRINYFLQGREVPTINPLPLVAGGDEVDINGNLKSGGTQFSTPGSYVAVVRRIGIQNNGIKPLEKTLNFAVTAKPTPPPPPPPGNLRLTVENQNNGFFSIAEVRWTVWQQMLDRFDLLTQVGGMSVTVQPRANGQQYHIHADVFATRLFTGTTELAEFRGTATTPDGVTTLVLVWDGAEQSRHFRLEALSQTVDLGDGGLQTVVNPVVVLIG